MSDELLDGIISCYKIKSKKAITIKLSGGITNFVYKINFDNKSYVAKIITSKKAEEIEKSEQISFLASKNGVKSLTAIKNNNKYVQTINGYNVLLYNYYDGKTLLTKELNLMHMRVLAHQLANLHNTNCKKANLSKYKKNNYSIIYKMIENSDESCFAFFKKNIVLLNDIYDKVYNCYLSLSNQSTYVHRDFIEEMCYGKVSMILKL